MTQLMMPSQMMSQPGGSNPPASASGGLMLPSQQVAGQAQQPTQDDTDRQQYAYGRWAEYGHTALQSMTPQIRSYIQQNDTMENGAGQHIQPDQNYQPTPNDAINYVKGTLPPEQVQQMQDKFEGEYYATRYIRKREQLAEALAQQYIGNAKAKGVDPTANPNDFQSGMYQHVHQQLAQYGYDPANAGQLPPVAIGMNGLVQKADVGTVRGYADALARGTYGIKAGLVDAPAQLLTAGAASVYDQFNGGRSGTNGADVSYNPIRTGLQAEQNQQRDVMSAFPQSTAAQQNPGGFQSIAEAGTEQVPGLLTMAGLSKLGAVGHTLMYGSMFAQGANQTYQNVYTAGKQAGLTDSESANRAMGSAVIVGAAKAYLMSRYGAAGNIAGNQSRMTSAVLGAIGQAGAGGGGRLMDDFAEYASTGKVNDNLSAFLGDVAQNAIGGGLAGAAFPPQAGPEAAPSLKPQADASTQRNATSPNPVLDKSNTGLSGVNTSTAGNTIRPITAEDSVIGNGTRLFTGQKVQVLGSREEGVVQGMMTKPLNGDKDFVNTVVVKMADGTLMYRTPQVLTDANGSGKAPERVEPDNDMPVQEEAPTVQTKGVKELAGEPQGPQPVAQQNEYLAKNVKELQELNEASNVPEPAAPRGNGAIEVGEPATGDSSLIAPTEEEHASQQQRASDFENQKNAAIDAGVKESVDGGLLKMKEGASRDATVSLESLRRSLEHFFQKGTDGKPVTMEQVDASTPEQKVAQQIAGKLGREIVFYKSNVGKVGGSVGDNAPNIINVNAEGSHPVLGVLGHELTHSFRRADPKVYTDLLDAIQTNDPDAIKRGMDQYYKNAGNDVLQKRLKDDPNLWKEEGAASVMMEAFQSRKFWDQMSRRDPNFFQSVAKTVVDFVRRIEGLWKGTTGLVKKPEVLANIADVLSDYTDSLGETGQKLKSGVDNAEGPVTVSATPAKTLLTRSNPEVGGNQGSVATSTVKGAVEGEPTDEPTPTIGDENIGTPRKIAPAKATSFDQVKVKQATGITPQSSGAADLFNRAFNDKLTAADEHELGLDREGKGNRAKAANTFRLSLVTDIQTFEGKEGNQGASDDAKAKLAASFVGILKRDAKMMLGERSSQDAVNDAVQTGLQALTQQLSGERRLKAEREQGPKVMDFDPEVNDNVHKFLYPAMFRAMQKQIFPVQTKSEAGTTQTARPEGALPVNDRGEVPIAATSAKSVLDQIISDENDRDVLSNKDVIGQKSETSADLNATLKQRGAQIEGFDGERAIVKLSPTGEPSDVSTSPDRPNLYRSKAGQLEIYNANGDYYARQFGSEGGFRRVGKADAAELDTAAKEGRLLPPAEDIAKVFDTFGETSPNVTFLPNKAGPGEDPDELRIMIGKAQAEQAPNKTIGRPELANPASGGGRDVVNAIDELRKNGGVPAVKPDSQTAAEAAKLDQGAIQQKLHDLADGKDVTISDAETFAAKKLADTATQSLLKGGTRQAQIDAARTVIGYREAGTQAARALRARFDENMTPAERFNEYLNKALMPTPKKIGPGSTAGRPEGGGGVTPEALVDEADRVKSVLKPMGIDLDNITEANMKDRDWMDRVMREIQAMKSSKADVAYEYWRNSILSALTTPVKKTISDTAQTVWDFVPQRIVEAMTNAFTGSKDGAQLGEFKHILAGVWPGLQMASRNMMRAFSNEVIPYDDELPTIGQIDKAADASTGYGGSIAIGGKLGRVVRLPTRSLRAIDAFYTTLDAHMQVGAEAYRIAKKEGLSGEDMAARMHDLTGDLGSDAWQNAIDKANQLTFKAQSKAADVASTLKEVIPGGRWILPFTKTPANIFSTGFRKSPLGSIPLAVNTAKDFVNLRPGKTEWTYLRSREGSQALAEQTLAWAGMIALHSLVQSGVLTGTGTSQAQEKEGERDLRARTSPPQSLRIGNQWYSYKNIEPVGTAVGTIVNLLGRWDEATKANDPGKFVTGSMQDLVGIVRDESMVKGIGDIIRATEDPTQNVPKWAANFAVSWVPNIVRSGMRAGDEKEPDTNIGGKGVQWTKELAKHTARQALPGVFDEPPKVDLWGRPQKKNSPTGSPATDWLYRLIVPVDTQGTDKTTDLDRLILNWNNAHPEQQFFPAPPPRSFKRSDGTLQVPPKAYERFAEHSGKLAYQLLSGMGLNADKPRAIDMKIIRDVLSKARTASAAQQFGAAKMSEEMTEEYMQAQHNNENAEFAAP